EARASRELLRIHTDVPVELDLEALRYRGASRAQCFELFTELGFRTLVMEYAPTAETTEREYRLVTSAEELQSLVHELEQAGRVALRVLPDRSSSARAAIVGLAFSSAERRARYVPLGHRGMHDGPQLSVGDALATLKPLLENPAVEKIGHDLKFDAIV